MRRVDLDDEAWQWRATGEARVAHRYVRGVALCGFGQGASDHDLGRKERCPECSRKARGVSQGHLRGRLVGHPPRWEFAA